ncbi:hypothetical protein GWK47_024727 [Chionoecetes opilio]|uniref:Uncharacterized protein n=1 Tax=Chionoecetes opilio TaxID=41210 RepID=A0A8J4XM25_CHIOP|nr:hypothetical protein GWK47_024727 [Chionoecetes opilio]
MFGPRGVISADDTIIYDKRLATLTDDIAGSLPRFLKYFTTRVAPLVRQVVAVVGAAGCIDQTWTNNNCESVNPVLKHLIDWQPQPAHHLAKTLILHIQAQYKDVERAMICPGHYKLPPDSAGCSIKLSVYATKTVAETETMETFSAQHGNLDLSLLLNLDLSRIGMQVSGHVCLVSWPWIKEG